MKKTTFFVRILDISPYGFTQILSGRACLMQNLIITFFQVFLIFGVAGSIKSMQCGYSLDVELNSPSNKLSCSEFE